MVKGDVIGADTETCTICSITDLDANAVDPFGEFTGTYIGEFNFSLKLLVSLRTYSL